MMPQVMNSDPAVGTRRKKGIKEYKLTLALTGAAAAFIVLLPSLSYEGKVSIFALAFATVLWTTTTINAAFSALLSVVVLILLGGVSQDLLFDSLASDIVWLMIGTFVLGGAMQITGLAERMSASVLSRAKTVGGLFWLLTAVLQPLALFIPSTSGRAAVTIPLFHSLSDTLEDKRIVKALALLIPTVILVSTISTLIGAGSHLIAVDLLGQIAGEHISFLQWMVWGLPFGIVASFGAGWLIMRLFLNREIMSQELSQNIRASVESSDSSMTRNETFTLTIIGFMVVGWLTESLHGFDIAMVTMVGALLLTMPNVGAITWKDGLKHVSWNLIIFVGAALALGQALTESGASEWIKDSLFKVTDSLGDASMFIVLLVIILLSLTSHLYMTSHTTRAVVLVPPFLYLASVLELNPTAVLFLATVGMDYCLTFPVSSKALLMFQETEVETFEPKDLLRLSAVLGLFHLVLMIVFYYTYWQWTGLTL